MSSAPLSRREIGLGPTGPHEGVPSWLQHSLWNWTQGQMIDRAGVRVGLLGVLELELRLPLTGDDDYDRFGAFAHTCKFNDEAFLDIVDYLARQLSDQSDSDRAAAQHLLNILGLAGSVWQVGKSDGRFRLRRVLDPAVEEAIAQVLSPEDRASHLLRDALVHGYGRGPNAGIAYREAVRAVEAIGKRVVIPNDGVATLGKMILAIEAKPSKWQVVLNPSRGDPVLAVVEMMRLLWVSEFDRHGTDDETVPLNVSLEEARAAIHLAVTLVQLFRSGAISRR